MIVGAGDGPWIVFGVGAREHHTVRLPDGTLEGVADWGAYTADETALRHGAAVEEETTDAEVAYARFSGTRADALCDRWLPR